MEEVACQMRGLETSLLGIWYGRVLGRWYWAEVRRLAHLFYSPASTRAVVLHVSESPIFIHRPLLRRHTAESAPTLSESVPTQ